MEHVRTAALMASTLTMGLAAGVFGIWANAIMPGLRDTDDRTFVGAFQSIDEAILNPLFMSIFVGALLATGLTAGLHLGGGERSRLPWILAAFLLYLAVFVITIGISEPLNEHIRNAGDPDRIRDLAAVREQFDEERWGRWNIVRAVATSAAFGCLAWALVLHGRAATSSETARQAVSIPAVRTGDR